MSRRWLPLGAAAGAVSAAAAVHAHGHFATAAGMPMGNRFDEPGLRPGGGHSAYKRVQ